MITFENKTQKVPTGKVIGLFELLDRRENDPYAVNRSNQKNSNR